MELRRTEAPNESRHPDLIGTDFAKGVLSLCARSASWCAVSHKTGKHRDDLLHLMRHNGGVVCVSGQWACRRQPPASEHEQASGERASKMKRLTQCRCPAARPFQLLWCRDCDQITSGLILFCFWTRNTSLPTANLARRRIDPAAWPDWLSRGRKSGTVAGLTFNFERSVFLNHTALNLRL